MSKRVGIDEDRRLFVTQAAWGAEALPEYSLVEYVRWICVQLSEDEEEIGELPRILLTLLRMDSPAQIEAEEKLIELLKTTFYCEVPTWETTDVPTRNVDWTETYRRSLIARPTRFVSRKVERKPDGELIGALVYQAYQWRDILRTSNVERHKRRAESLTTAIEERHGHGTAIRSRPMNRAILNRLRRHGPRAKRAARAILTVFTRQHSRPSAAELDEAIHRAVDESSVWIGQDDERGNKALNHLLEFSVLSAITQTAARSEAWKLVSLDTEEMFFAHLVHTSHPLELVIDKSAPCDDAFREVRRQAGMTKHVEARDSQPDICLTFTNRVTEESVTVLGDTKRNGDVKNEGASYFRDSLRTATYYLAAFSEATGCHFDDEHRPVGKIRPTFTLFFRQGTEAKKVRRAIEGPIESIPPVLACDITNHFGLDVEEGANGEDLNRLWSSSFLKTWLERLSEQAVEVLVKESDASNQSE